MARRMAPELRKRHLIEVALTLFAQKPPEQVSIDDIAEHANVSRPLVYRYFPSTAAIHVAALERATEELRGRWTGDLKAAVTAFVDFASDYAPAYLALLRSGSVVSTSDTAALIDGVREHALAMITDGDPNPWLTLTVRCWIAVVEGATLAWLQHPHCERDELVTWLLDQFAAMTSVSRI